MSASVAVVEVFETKCRSTSTRFSSVNDARQAFHLAVSMTPASQTVRLAIRDSKGWQRTDVRGQLGVVVTPAVDLDETLSAEDVKALALAWQRANAVEPAVPAEPVAKPKRQRRSKKAAAA